MKKGSNFENRHRQYVLPTSLFSKDCSIKAPKGVLSSSILTTSPVNLTLCDFELSLACRTTRVIRNYAFGFVRRSYSHPPYPCKLLWRFFFENLELHLVTQGQRQNVTSTQYKYWPTDKFCISRKQSGCQRLANGIKISVTHSYSNLWICYYHIQIFKLFCLIKVKLPCFPHSKPWCQFSNCIPLPTTIYFVFSPFTKSTCSCRWIITLLKLITYKKGCYMHIYVMYY